MAHRRLRGDRLAGAALGALGMLFSFACGGEDEGEVVGGGATTGNGGGSQGGSGGSGGVTVGGSGGVAVGGSGGAGSCNPPCATGTFCSSTGNCIADGTCAANADCGAGLVCDTATGACIPGGGCGAEEFAITGVAPNMFVSLDRSCSMTAGGGGGQTKWQIAVAAMNQMLTKFSGKIRWGLGLFPDIVTPACDQAAAQFAVGDGNESGIKQLLTASLQAADKFFPDGPCVTNIDTALQQASKEPAFTDKTRKSYVLLITDGKQAGCNAAGGDLGSENIIKTMFTAGVSTFVVGFDNTNSIDPVQMNKFAVAGGVPNNDPTDPTTKYYKANSASTLEAVLEKIGGAVASCSYTLSKPPSDASKVYVFFDNVKVARDPTHTSGWDYDPTTNQITFYGADCDKLKAGSVKDVDVVFGCDQPTPG